AGFFVEPSGGVFPADVVAQRLADHTNSLPQLPGPAGLADVAVPAGGARVLLFAGVFFCTQRILDLLRLVCDVVPIAEFEFPSGVFEVEELSAELLPGEELGHEAFSLFAKRRSSAGTSTTVSSSARSRKSASASGSGPRNSKRMANLSGW